MKARTGSALVAAAAACVGGCLPMLLGLPTSFDFVVELPPLWEPLPMQGMARVDEPVMLWGGEDRTVLLGCLYCPASHPLSVSNREGLHGPKGDEYSLWNPDGRFGSQDSDLSACNPRALHPPILRTRGPEGERVYGRLTIGPHPERVDNDELLRLVRRICRSNLRRKAAAAPASN